MRLLISCSELGLGHYTRMVELGRRLQKNNHELFFFSGGKAFQLLQKEFKNVYPCTPIAWYENGHGIITSASMINMIVPLPIFNVETNKLEMKSSSVMEIIHHYYDLRENIKSIAPDMLIADGDINALRLAERWKIPSVYVANVIRPSYGFSIMLSPGERLVERYVKQTTKIIIPDNPSPNTISEYNVGDLQRIGVEEKTEFVGSFLDTKLVKGSDDHIFVPISGPLGTRARLQKITLPVLQKLNAKSVISLGVPGKKTTIKIGNIEIHTWLSSDERRDCMKNAKLVIFSGGHNACFETVKYAKPSICIPTQPEQFANAQKLQDLGCSLIVKNQKELINALKEIENKQNTFNRNMLTLNRFSSKKNGLDRAVEIIENLLN